ncbi:hypothetical protein VMCG_05217 [Cytospora schulzeri]|uniref:Uncharacterized protein n=1 Tax=Cytospora schulzeri TaxID=448051 RepID=A0A423WQG3_9PEZI|nr:hypothetical protein VMCG_05217 [Valsa malicola]
MPDKDMDQHQDALIDGSDGGRVHIEKYSHVYKFSPGEEVYLYRSGAQEGPYLIYSRGENKYRLSDKYGNLAKNGEAFSEGELMSAD